MEDWISYIILAIVQGITEFLPVSSSGHLVLFNSFYDFDAGILFDLALHVATLFSVCAYYRKDIWGLLAGGFRELSSMASKGEDGKADERPNLWMMLYIVVATFITGVIGILTDDYISSTFRTTLVVGINLIITSLILFASRKVGALRMCDGRMNLKTALIIGLVQGFAVLPGISRSGSTITAALLLGVESKDCAKFSFLLSIPVILGGFILHVFKVESFDTSLLPVFIISMIISAIIGYACLVVLESLLKKAKFYRFSLYCFVVGIVAIILHFV